MVQQLHASMKKNATSACVVVRVGPMGTILLGCKILNVVYYTYYFYICSNHRYYLLVTGAYYTYPHQSLIGW